LLFFLGELGLLFLAEAGVDRLPPALFRFVAAVAAALDLDIAFGEDLEGELEFGLLLPLLLPPLPPLGGDPSFVFDGGPYAAAFIG
jgi:hypothetical protein